MPDPFSVLAGGRHRPHPYVCPWCGSVFEYRHVADAPGEIESLEGHWRNNPKCKALANVNNQTSSKQGAFGEERVAPGEYTLGLVQAAEDAHDED